MYPFNFMEQFEFLNTDVATERFNDLEWRLDGDLWGLFIVLIKFGFIEFVSRNICRFDLLYGLVVGFCDLELLKKVLFRDSRTELKKRPHEI